MYQMLGICLSLESLDLTSFDTSSVNLISYMLINCFSLISLNLSYFFKLTGIDFMFVNCSSSLTSLNISHFNININNI